MAAHDTTSEPLVRLSALADTADAARTLIRNLANRERDVEELRIVAETAAADIAQAETAFRDILAARPDQVRPIAAAGAKALQAAHRAALKRIEEIDRISAEQRGVAPAPAPEPKADTNILLFPGRRS